MRSTHVLQKELAACPFPSCDSRHSGGAESTAQIEERGGAYVVECSVCCGGTGSFHSEQAAIAEWNALNPFDARMHFTYEDLWKAYEAGANDAHANWKAGPQHFGRAADAYCKLIHAERDPKMFAALGGNSVGRGNEEHLADQVNQDSPSPAPPAERLNTWMMKYSHMISDSDAIDELQTICALSAPPALSVAQRETEETNLAKPKP